MIMKKKKKKKNCVHPNVMSSSDRRTEIYQCGQCRTCTKLIDLMPLAYPSPAALPQQVSERSTNRMTKTPFYTEQVG
jgi:hypothetical protein